MSKKPRREITIVEQPPLDAEELAELERLRREDYAEDLRRGRTAPASASAEPGMGDFLEEAEKIRASYREDAARANVAKRRAARGG